MNSKLLNNDTIKAEAMSLGFFACGIARAERISKDEEKRLRRWIADGNYGDMQYMANHIDIRLDPRLLLDGAKTIVSVAMNYAPKTYMQAGQPQMAAYSYGLDYHDIVRKKLYALASALGLNYNKEIKEPEQQEFRVCVDTAPIIERYWAQQAGIGWQGRSHQLIIPHAGTMFFLGELIIATEVDTYDKPMDSHCGSCCKCIDACPTKALRADGTFCSSQCLSYITIESHDSEIADDIAHSMGNTFYGCDRCQQACPWNRFATATDIPELQPKQELLDMTWDKWQTLTEDDYRRLFKGCAAKRAKYEGIMRNIRAITKANNK